MIVLAERAPPLPGELLTAIAAGRNVCKRKRAAPIDPHAPRNPTDP